MRCRNNILLENKTQFMAVPNRKLSSTGSYLIFDSGFWFIGYGACGKYFKMIEKYYSIIDSCGVAY